MASASRSNTCAFCKASVAVFGDCCASDGTARKIAATAKSKIAGHILRAKSREFILPHRYLKSSRASYYRLAFFDRESYAGVDSQLASTAQETGGLYLLPLGKHRQNHRICGR